MVKVGHIHVKIDPEVHRELKLEATMSKESMKVLVKRMLLKEIKAYEDNQKASS